MPSWELSLEYEEEFHAKLSSKRKPTKSRKKSRQAFSSTHRDKTRGKAKRGKGGSKDRMMRMIRKEKISAAVERATIRTYTLPTESTKSTKSSRSRFFILSISWKEWKEFDLSLYDDRRQAYFVVLDPDSFLSMRLRETILRKILRFDAAKNSKEAKLSACVGRCKSTLVDAHGQDARNSPLKYLLEIGREPNLLKMMLEFGVKANDNVCWDSHKAAYRPLYLVLRRERRGNYREIIFRFVKLLLQFGADPNESVSSMSEACSPLCCVLTSNWDKDFMICMVKLLLDFGADWNRTLDKADNVYVGGPWSSVLVFSGLDRCDSAPAAVERATIRTYTLPMESIKSSRSHFYIPSSVNYFDLNLYDDRRRAYFVVINPDSVLSMRLRETILQKILRFDIDAAKDSKEAKLSACVGPYKWTLLDAHGQDARNSPLKYLLEIGTAPNLLKLMLEFGVKANDNVCWHSRDVMDDWNYHYTPVYYPLYLVLRRKDREIVFRFVKLLLQFGADPNASASTFGDRSPLHCVLTSNWDKDFKICMVELLLDFGADLNRTVDELGCYGGRWHSVLLFRELDRCDSAVIKFLAKRGAKPTRDCLDVWTRVVAHYPHRRDKQEVFPSHLLDEFWFLNVFWDVWTWGNCAHMHRPLGSFEGTFLELWVRCGDDELAKDFAAKMRGHVDALRQSTREWDCVLLNDCVQVILDMVFDCKLLNELKM